MSNFDNHQHWQSQYESKQTPWDMGHASPALLAYVDREVDKAARILIPGAGRAYEAVTWWQQGYHNVYVLDWANAAFDHLRKALPDFPDDHILVQDFFALEERFDYMIEQTFFCALPPEQRPEYVAQAAKILRNKGILAGLLFNRSFDLPGPPFGGQEQAYRDLFSEHFDLLHLDTAEHSIKPRAGNELFIIAQSNIA